MRHNNFILVLLLSSIVFMSSCYRDARGPEYGYDYFLNMQWDSMDRSEIISNLALLAQQDTQPEKGPSRPRLIKLTRDIDTFHYEKDGSGTARYLEPDSTNYGHFVNSVAKKAGNLRQEMFDFNTWLGDGFYVAADPLTTRSYATPNFLGNWDSLDYSFPWNLFRVTIPSGSRILDLGVKNLLPPSLVETLKNDYACDVSQIYYNGTKPSKANPNPDFYDLFVVTDEARQGCRAIVNDVLNEIGDITAVAYTFKTSYQKLQSCKKAAGRALIIVGKVPTDSVRAFSEVLPASGSDSADRERLMIEALYNKFRIPAQPPLWPSLDYVNPLTDQDLEEYAKDRLWGCGEYDEDPRTFTNHNL